MYTVHVSIALIGCRNIHFFSLFTAGDVSRRGTCPVAKREEKRMFSQAIALVP